MEQQPTFQWSVFNADRSQQWVVRADTFEDFIEAIARMRSLLPDYLNLQETKPEEDAGLPPPSPSFCYIHNKQMKLRTNKNGEEWYDHRWKEGETWKQCNGERVRES